MRAIGTTLAFTLTLGTGLAHAGAPTQSLRPEARTTQLRAAAVTTSGEDARLQTWLAEFRGRALAEGIRPDVYDAALAGVRYDADIIRRDSNQAEFVKPIWEYLDSAVSDARIANGRMALDRHADVLARIEAHYGVDREVVAAIWGLESAYGAYRGSTPILQALATLAYDGRRGAFFEEQLIAALRIIQSGDVRPSGMTGSWAGAMGHTQFMPTSYLAYAADFHGDGRRDIWSDDPTDALASTAAYLARFGWVQGMPWGVEVRLPNGFDYALAGRDTKAMPSDWARRGVVGLDGRPVRDFGSASLLLPAGARGPAFLIFKNFEVIERYNTADAYVIGVGHLADRLRGGDPIQGDWPRGDRALAYAERQELQQRLTALGFPTQGVDGRIGPNTIAAIRSFQRAAGLVPDGYASLDLLTRLR
ncbi:lytic murein transglycosylase [Roseitranquillus sediminis]|uniref:lytic murein transglycosylase n=1 Tax=Roseitranquillus sediminis TaxID=2809051 RepID=UPI001D0C5BB2|nr:lytic murein transglycosylase [Roseitranquillus sediminis]MBM9596192.1 lytic murein transglycosylase [Roseitranquillus sediminis]